MPMTDLHRWLEELGLSEYGPLFGEHRIDRDVLPDLDETDLKELGIPLGHRKKLLKAIAALGPSHSISQERHGFCPSPESPIVREAERRHLTVLFCDLAGSTELSSRLDPEDVRFLVERYQEACRRAITAYDGFIARYMGDGVLAYFGYPNSHEDDAERAVRSALSLVGDMRRVSDETGRPLGSALEVRIGIATGLVVVGNLIGEGASQESPVVGETPNVAARLQALAEPGAVLIPEATRKLLGRAFEFRSLGARTLKGVADPIDVWEVLGTSGVASRFEASTGLELTPLVGREEEIGMLRSRWQRCRDGEGQVVLVSGEPGIGKSRLAEALRAAIASDSHTVLHYQCSPHHVNSAFFPVVTQLERAARIARQEAPSTKLNKLAALMAKATPDVGDDLALIGSLLSIPAGGPDSGPQLEPDQRKTRTLAALVRQLEGLVTGTPVLCVFEDVHWIDPSTLELLERLVERVETLPALVLVTCRPEFTAPWAGQPHTTLIALSRLDRRQARAVVEQIGERFPLADDLVTEIVGKTDGIPLFIEELTRAVLDTTRVQHMPTPGNDEPSLSSVGIPSTLQDSLMSRLDRLSVGKPVAQMAAALGREFSRELIATVAEYGDEEIETALEELVRSGLVFRRGAGAGARYVFKHALVQDAAYQSMLRTARRDLHDRIAAVLIEQFPEAVEINPELVAHHDTEAGNLARAASYWRQAGKRAADRAAHVEAIGHYSRGLALLEALDDDTLVASLGIAFNLGLAASMRVLERRDEAFEALDRAESAGETAKDAAGLTDVHYLRGNLFFPQGRIDECLREHERSLDLARRHGLAEKEARALGGMGDAYYLRGRIVTAGRLVDTCVGLCQEHDFRRIRAAYQPMRGLVRFFEMRFDEADEDAKTGAALAAEIGEARPRIVAQQVLSYVLADMARNAEAVAAGEHATALARRLGTPNLEASAKAHMARALYGVGERGAAVELLREAYEMIRASGLAFLGPTVLGYLAWTTSDERERSWALDTGESLLGKDTVSHNFVRFYRFAAETCLEAGQWDEAARYADALEEYTRPEPIPMCDLIVERIRALVAHGRGDPEASATQALERVLDQANTHGFRSLTEMVEQALSRKP